MAAEALLPPLILELRAKAGEAIAQVKELGKEVEDTSQKTSKPQAAFNQLAGIGKAALTGLAGSAVAVGVEAIHMADAMSQSDARIAGAAQIPVQAAQKIGDAFLGTAFKSTFSGKEMADAFGPVAGVVQALAGHVLTAGDSMKFMSAATDLAEASGQPLNIVTQSLASTMQAYGLKLGDAAEASNTLFNVSRLTGTGITDLTAVVNRLHGRLGIASPDLQTTGALMADLAQHGINGSRGVMVVQSAFSTLLGGSKKVQTELKGLGVSVYDSSGKFVGMQSVLTQLQPKLAGMTDQQRQLALANLFGASAGTAMSNVVLGGAAAFNRASRAVATQDAVQKAAEASSNSLHGQIEKLHAGFEDIVTIIGERLVPIIEAVIGWFAKHKAAVLILAGVIGGALTVAIAAYVAKLVWGAAETVGNLAKMVLGWAGIGPAADAAAAETEAAGAVMDTAFGPVGIAIAAVGAAAVLLATHWRQVWGMMKAAAQAVWNDGLKPVFDAIKTVVSDVVDWVGAHWKILVAVVAVLLGPIGVIGGAIALLATHWHDVWHAMMAVYDATIRPMITGLGDAFRAVMGAIDGALHGIESIWTSVWSGMGAAAEAAVGVTKSVLNDLIGLINLGINAINGLIDGFNGAMGGLSDVWTWTGLPGIPAIPDIPQIPYLAKGGIVTRPTLAVIGEAGPEAVVPLGGGINSGGAGITPLPAGQGGGSAAPVEIHVHGAVLDGPGFSAAVQEAMLQLGARNSQTWQPYRRGR